MPQRVPPEMFRFAVGDRSDLYTAVLQAFAHANDRLETALGLDDGTPLAGVVLRAFACLHGTAPPANAEDRRALWERMGVTEDQLSASVLAAGLRPTGPASSRPSAGWAPSTARPSR